MSKPTVLLGLSGGVDSAAAATILLEKGYDVQPILMHNWQEDAHCTIKDDIKDCQAICDHLGLTLDIINFQAEYRNRVFDHCLKLFKQGLTPNPDILCNSQIKFDVLKKHCLQKDCQYFATGHYAQTEKREGAIALMCAPDLIKDQTYFLAQLTQSQLDKTYFPIGNLTKNAVRDIALRQSLPNAHKKDSTGICFIGERRFDHFLKEHLLTRPGKAIDCTGKVVGTHDGLFFYTIGQRRRLGIGGVKHANPAPWYVIEKNLTDNTLVVSQNKSLLYKKVVKTETPHWIRAQISTHQPIQCKLRHGPNFVDAHIISQDPEHAVIEFKEAQEAPTPGQYLVFYKDNECLGSAMITEQL
ncbi:tRNA 2-thiouridine(34) synthase MnmA [Candidatus Comchoanobacter bicostacola]|uniref:tRNA-specific 2-thiouridylase MnmA n=1 Tax=Candidatus Comchoanobacter bicostacola TaxID=2919598 RepID=A0ABY5DHE8_9GAMM|nr:tRNA 2-thiouridine(34) synthase MnmA [Candidatus Comchoanobacter bicostacola]UTC24165.1 tRNA 2-thiouridine(34) synthase MnmA [Candidatus Comchoanobacter bicostacola]